MRSQGENPAKRGTGRSVPGRAAEQQTVMGRKYGRGSIFGAGRVILEIGKHQGRQPKREKALPQYFSADTGHSWSTAALPRQATEQNGQKTGPPRRGAAPGTGAARRRRRRPARRAGPCGAGRALSTGAGRRQSTPGGPTPRRGGQKKEDRDGTHRNL